MEHEDKVIIAPMCVIEDKWTFRDEEMAALYNRTVTEGLKELLFYDGTVNTVEDFINSIHTGNNLVFIPFVDREPIGIIWLNRFDGETAQGHYVFFKDYWGTGLPEAASRKFCRIATEYLFPTLIGVTPMYNKHALQFCKDYGMHEVGIVPKMVWSEAQGKSVDAMIHYISIDDFKGEDNG